MSSRRMAARVPSAGLLGTGYVIGYVLRFHKRGRIDSSGKANMIRTGLVEDQVWGVVWEIDPTEKPELDRVEGLGAGYEEERVKARMADPRSAFAENGRIGHILRARACVSDPAYIDDRLLPYEWYRDFVLSGAREHGLPEEYAAAIESRESQRDPAEEWRERNRRILTGAP